MTGPTWEDDPKAFVREVFDSIVRRYDLANDVISLGLHRLWRRRAVRLLGLRQGTLLDLGAGTGVLTALTRRSGYRGCAVLCDLSPAMLHEAGERLGSGDISLVCGDGEELPFKAGAFQGVLLGFSLRNMPGVRKALREIRRTLSSSGRVVILEMSRPGRLLQPFFHLYLRFLMPVLGGWATGERRSYEHLRDSTLAFPGAKALEGLMQEAGFATVRYRRLLGGVAAIHIGEKA